MGIQTVPAFISQAGYQHPAEVMRNYIEAMAGGRSGICRYGQMAVTGTGVSNQIQVSQGMAVLVGAESGSQGAYFAWSDASELITVPAADASNPRIDTLLLRVADPQYGTISGSPRAYFDVVQGVAAASPSQRTNTYFNVGGAGYQPGAYLRIADFRRNVGDTTVVAGRIYPAHYYARMANRVVGMSTSSTTGYGGMSSVSDAVAGDRYYAVDTGKSYTHNGTDFIQDPPCIVAQSTRTANASGIGATETAIDTWTFTAISGHKYRLSWLGSIEGVDACELRCRYAAGASVARTDTLIKASYYQPSATNKAITYHLDIPMVGILPAGQVTVGVFAIVTTSGTFNSFANSTNPCMAYIEDLGF